MLRGSWPTPGRILGRVPGGAPGKTDKVFWESVEIMGEAFWVDFLGGCLGRSVKELGTSRQIFAGILAAIPGSFRTTDLGIPGQLMQSVWGDTGKIPGEPWGKCWLRNASGILMLGGSRYVPWGAHKMFCKVLGDSLQVPWGFLGECD